ncbi:MAG: hypothetical protein JST31_09245 [Actinobacteria bacterium]|nr:hypothetical protein [Actinomycetota bacterium]
MGTLARLLSSQGETMVAQMEERTGEEVLAAGQLRQGRKPSLAAMITGTALIGLAKPRRSKQLPRQFCLAATPSRVVAYACTGVADDEDGTNFHVVVRGEERASWPRQAVGFEGTPAEGFLAVAGERFPIHQPNLDGDPETDALLAVLSR